jgi:type III restriction enzyme
MLDRQQIQNEDLLLTVSKNVDPSRFDLDRYEPFIDTLCGTREYQKEVIRTVLRYFLGGRYASLRQLAEENYNAKGTLQECYGTFHEMERHLQFPDQLSCSVDLATATGKSYVIYGIARIMLAQGAVDRVLVLCPSRTIESGLTEKFRFLSADTTLRTLLPESSRVRNPHIINGTETIVDGTICVENFHATLANVKSSIRDSLNGKGARTLVLNDEVHHVYNPSGKELKRWKEFLLDPQFGFLYLAGFSGTCYVGDDYFADVVARYSLRQAIEQGYAKTIDYVAEDTSTSQDEKFQKIYDNHLQNKNYYYRKVKPLTILVTRDIADCKRVTDDLTEYIADQEGIPLEVAAKKVLIVTSAKEHQLNIRALKDVDRPENAIEWICSVSMLTEGWDVQNVFQIVPHEERAFNSKLLIAQVLGRGLRIPEAYRGERIAVTVFNHDTWSSSIKHLVDEVMEIEKRLYSYPVVKTTDYNFSFHQIVYDPVEEVENFEQQGEYEFTKGYVSLMPQNSSLERETTYARATGGEQRQKKTLVHYQMHSVTSAAEHIHLKLKAIDTEKETNYSEKYSIEWLEELIRRSLQRIGDTSNQVSEENRQRLQKAFGVVHREASQVVRRQMKPNTLEIVNTAARQRSSVGISSLRRTDATVVYDDNTLVLSDEDTRVVLEKTLEDESLPISAWLQVPNSFHFKTPLNLVIANRRPERVFLRYLTKSENAIAIDGWIKSTDQDFYSIEFAWRKREHTRRSFFNPDFFVKQGNHIWVIEIKDDEEVSDPSPENKGKYKAANLHFDTLNSLQNECIYHFHFLAPEDYDLFFPALRQQNYTFVSRLDVALSENGV